MTSEQEKRITQMMKEYAGSEAIKIEQITSSIYVFGSELACLRIFTKYNANGAVHNKHARVGYSENQTSWYFVLENVNLAKPL